MNADKMKVIGILGGMSAASTQIYYRYLCTKTRDLLGGLHSPELLIRSVDFAVIEKFQMEGNWQAAGERLYREARLLERRAVQGHHMHRQISRAKPLDACYQEAPIAAR